MIKTKVMDAIAIARFGALACSDAAAAAAAAA